MKILFIGDVVASAGVGFIKKSLWNIRKMYGADLVIANGENSADGNGILPVSADALFDAGVDVITGGNHSFKRREIYTYLDEKEHIIRPANYPPGVPGKGICKAKASNGTDVTILNLSGLTYMDSIECPFRTADKLLEGVKTPIKIIDFHAEATSEKRALAEYLCGKVTAVIGTHTHIQTADESILGGFTGFITDAGMTAPSDSVLGVGKEEVVGMFLNKLPTRFKPGAGKVALRGVLLTADETSGKCTAIERIAIDE